MRYGRLTGLCVLILVGTLASSALAEDGDLDRRTFDVPEGTSLSPSMLGKIGNGADGDGTGDILDSLTFKGSVDVAYTYNFNNSKASAAAGGPENALRVNDVFHNEFTPHNAILYIQREVSEERMFGFSVVPSVGTDNGSFLGGGGLNFGGEDMDVLELNAQAFAFGTKFEIGKFLTTAGGEVIDSGRNAMFSRTFMFGNGKPFTHTGVRASRSLAQREDGDDLLFVSLGYSNGWDSARDTNDGHVVLTNATLSPVAFWDFTVNWFFGYSDRPAFGADGNFSDVNDFSHLVDLVTTFDLGEAAGIEGLSLEGNFDWYGDENEGAYANYYAFAGIVKYEFPCPMTTTDEDRMYIAFRGEYFDDADGFITGGTGGEIWDLTWTLGYRPSDWMLIRGEVRLDKASGAAFEDNTRSSQTTVALNTVFMF